MIGKVHRCGFKPTYSDPTNHPDFNSFVRSVLGLLQTLLERMHEAVRNFYILASILVGKQRKFAAQMMEYIGSVWLRGHYDVHSWIMSGHQAQQTIDVVR